MHKILEALKFLLPKFYNRLTWAVVGAGLALVSAPLWETLVSAIISKKFDLSSYLPNDPLYGTILVVVGLAYHLASMAIENPRVQTSDLKTEGTDSKSEAKLQHDKELAKSFLTLAKETVVIENLEMIGADHSCREGSLELLNEIERFGDLTENQFLDQAIQQSMENFHASCQALTIFVVNNFFPMGNNHNRTYLYPHLNVDRGGSGSHEEMAEYHKYGKQLVLLVKTAMENYKRLRLAMKHELAI